MKILYSSNLSICITTIYLACSFLLILKYKASYNNLKPVYLCISNKKD